MQVLNRCLITVCLEIKKKNIGNFVFVSLTKTKDFRCLEALTKSKNEGNLKGRQSSQFSGHCKIVHHINILIPVFHEDASSSRGIFFYLFFKSIALDIMRRMIVCFADHKLCEIF